MSYQEAGLLASTLTACFTAHSTAYLVHLLPLLPSLPFVKTLPQLFPLKSRLYAQNFGVLGRGLSDGSYLIHWLSDILNKILLGSLIYTISQSTAAVKKLKVRGSELHQVLLFASYLPPILRAPPNKLKGATGHLCKPLI